LYRLYVVPFRTSKLASGYSGVSRKVVSSLVVAS
jgi:histidine ammonia-lyase